MDERKHWQRVILVALWVLFFISLFGVYTTYVKLAEYEDQLASEDGNNIVSLELAFSSDRAAKIIDGWAAHGRTETAQSSIDGDWLFIGAYLVLMLSVSGLMLRARYPHPPDWAFLPLILLPWAIASFDTIENLGMYYLLGSKQGLLFAITAPLVSIFAALKFLLVFAYLVVIVRVRFVNFQVLSLVRFSLLMLVIGFVSLFIPQWQEVLRAIGEDGSASNLAFWFSFAAMVAAVTSWYSARVMFMLNIPGQELLSSPGTAPFLKTWLPRVLGWLILLFAGIGLVKEAGFDWRHLGWLVAATVLYSAFVLLRRKILYFNIGDMNKTFGSANGWLDLPRPTMLALAVLAGLIVAAFVFALYDPLATRSLGGAAVVLGAVGLMIPIGTWLVYWGARWQLPVLLILFAMAAGLSLFNDNHWVRLSPGASSTDGDQRLELTEAYDEEPPGFETYSKSWAQELASAYPDGGDIPLYIVSAEGGGIRAAYWTALTLAAMQDREPLFAKHVFAISGVSGGSLGGAVFAAQVANGTPKGEFKHQADDMLREDFLAPTLATLLFPDLLQRFLPWPVFEDRAVTLEQGWEDAWRRASEGDDTFAEPFSLLWEGRQTGTGPESSGATAAPLLFLNSTVVEGGNRLIIHPLTLSDDAGSFERVFKDAIDGRAALGTNLPLSTAVHLSARFTYVSPAGSARNHAAAEQAAPSWMRLVDGGYFENSGTVTSTELIVELRRLIKEADNGSALARLHPFVIHISNEPLPLHQDHSGPGRQKQAPLGEVLSPLFALLKARPARGYQARDALFGIMSSLFEGERYVHFQLYQLDKTLPLGWVLSSDAREDMKSQLDPPRSAPPDSSPSENSERREHVRTLNQQKMDKVLALIDR